jgi:hypothetical protein
MIALRTDIALVRPDTDELNDSGALILRLTGSDSQKVALEFSSYHAYRKRDESFANRTLSLLTESVKPSIGFHWLYELQTSEFLAWFHEETLGIYADLDLRHYMVLTISDIVDIIATQPPDVSFRS